MTVKLNQKPEVCFINSTMWSLVVTPSYKWYYHQLLTHITTTSLIINICSLMYSFLSDTWYGVWKQDRLYRKHQYSICLFLMHVHLLCVPRVFWGTVVYCIVYQGHVCFCSEQWYVTNQHYSSSNTFIVQCGTNTSYYTTYSLRHFFILDLYVSSPSS